MKIAGTTFWITGASGGIGAELAAELQRRGGRIAISARRRAALYEVSQGRMHVEPVDITDRLAVREAVEAVRTALGSIDVAILNAGTWQQVRIDEFDAEAFHTQFDTNLMGTVHCIEALLPTMLADRRGVIAGMASVAGYRGLPGSEATRNPGADDQSRLRQDRPDRAEQFPDAVSHGRENRRQHHR